MQHRVILSSFPEIRRDFEACPAGSYSLVLTSDEVHIESWYISGTTGLDWHDTGSMWERVLDSRFRRR